MSHDAAQWIPLFPEEEVPFILAAVLRSGSRLKKLHAIEMENHLTDRRRDLPDRDPGLRARPLSHSGSAAIRPKTSSAEAVGQNRFDVSPLNRHKKALAVLRDRVQAPARYLFLWVGLPGYPNT